MSEGRSRSFYVLSFLFGLEVIAGLLILTLSECITSEPNGSPHVTSCGREHPLEPLIFLAVAVTLYVGSRWFERRDRVAGLVALGLLTALPPVAGFTL